MTDIEGFLTIYGHSDNLLNNKIQYKSFPLIFLREFYSVLVLQSMLYLQDGVSASMLEDINTFDYSWLLDLVRRVSWGEDVTNLLLVGMPDVVTPTHFDILENLYVQVSVVLTVCFYVICLHSSCDNYYSHGVISSEKTAMIDCTSGVLALRAAHMTLRSLVFNVPSVFFTL